MSVKTDELFEKLKSGSVDFDEAERRVLIIAMKVLQQVFAEKLPDVAFICGEGGEKDAMGLHEFYFICPSYGLEGMATYKKCLDYSAPGW